MKKITKSDKFNIPSNTNIRQGIEQAILIARALNSELIVQINGVRFGVNPDTKLQSAINTYLEIKNITFETEQQLTQKTR